MLPRRLTALAAAASAAVATLAGCASPGADDAAGTASTAGASVAAGAMPRRYADQVRTDGSAGLAAAPTASTSPPTTPPTTPLTTAPPPDACAGNPAGKRVLVDLSEQHLWFCARGHTVRDTAITSGMSGRDTATPIGQFRIQGRNRNTTLTLDTGATYDVRYWIPFQAPLYGFHDSSWQRFPYGGAQYRSDGSHGCVHMPLAQIAFLYRWAPIGTPVTIRR